MEWEDITKEEAIELAYVGEMAKILISAMDWKEDYEKYKDRIAKNLDKLKYKVEK